MSAKSTTRSRATTKPEGDVDAPPADVTEKTTDEPVGDIEIILPTPQTLEVGGVPAQVRRIKAREFLALMSVLLRGAGGAVQHMNFATDDEEQLQADLLFLVVTAASEATDDFLRFVKFVVEPRDEDQRALLNTRLDDLEIDDFMNIVGIVIEQEKDDMGALVGKARAWLAKMQKTLKK